MRSRKFTIVSLVFVTSLFFGYARPQFAQQREMAKRALRNAHRSKSVFVERLRALQTDEVVVEVSFEKSIPATDLLRVANSKEARVKYLVYQSGEHTGWYLLRDNESLGEALKNFSNEHSEFLRRQVVDYSVQETATFDAPATLKRLGLPPLPCLQCRA